MKVQLIGFVFSAILLKVSEGEHVHVKLRVPKMINKHTHVETKYIHVFHPHRTRPSYIPHREPSPQFPYPPSKDFQFYDSRILNRYKGFDTKKFYRKKYRKPSSYDFLDEEPSNQNYQYYDSSDYPLDRADTFPLQYVDKIWITTPPPPVFDRTMPSLTPPLPPNTQPQPGKTKLKLIRRPKQGNLQASGAKINIRFVTPQPRYPTFASFTTPFPMRAQRPNFKQTESVKMIQVPMNGVGENDVQIMLRAIKKQKDGEPAPTPEMEHSIKAKNNPNPLSNILNKKKALKEAIIKPLVS